jgi:hypothetical protein
MFSTEPAEQVAAARQAEANREHELGTERVVIHDILFLFCSRHDGSVDKALSSYRLNGAATSEARVGHRLRGIEIEPVTNPQIR